MIRAESFFSGFGVFPFFFGENVIENSRVVRKCILRYFTGGSSKNTKLSIPKQLYPLGKMQKRPAKTLDLIFFVLNFFGFFYLRNLREMIQCDEDVSEWD